MEVALFIMSLAPLLPLLDHLAGFQRLIQNLRDGVKRQSIGGLLGSSRAYLVAGLYNKQRRPILILTPTQEEAEEFKEDLGSFIEDVTLFPSWEILPYEPLSPPYEITDLRLSVLDRLTRREDLVIVAPIKAVLIKTIPPQVFSASRLTLKKGESLNMEELLSCLITLGYERIEMVEARGEFSRRGGIVDIYPVGFTQPTRIEFFDDKIESIRGFDPTSQRSTGMLNEITILPRRELIFTDKDFSQFKARTHSKRLINVSCNPASQGYFDGIEWYLPFFYQDLQSIFGYLEEDSLILLDEPDSILDQIHRINEEVHSRYQESIDRGEFVSMPEELFLSGEELQDSIKDFQSISTSLLEHEKEQDPLDFSVKPIDGTSSVPSLLLDQLLLWRSSGWRIIFVSLHQTQGLRIQELLKEMGIESRLGLEGLDHMPSITISHLSRGFVFEDLNLALISAHEIFPRARPTRRRFVPREEAQIISSLVELKVGDFVVHINYGIGRYLGIENIKVEGIRRDFLLLEYADGDRLYVPIQQLGLVQRYIGDKDHPPKIYRLGGNAWEQVKRRVKDSVRDMARELLDLYAVREALPGFNFAPDTNWQYEFEAGFKFEETPDQLRAIEEIKQDMEKPRPMDRLVCGDVGYGKTEVAIRAAFKAVMDNKQVAVLVPTTILAQQHLATFHERTSPFPINVEMLSRFKTPGEQRRIIGDLARGRVDVVIGTHRLLQKDVAFYDLGLVIIDEEQRFGVRHKEKLKNLRKLVDVLTLTATPIPRTMYMALTKTRDMSLITTPPPERFPIETTVARFDRDLVRDAILREIERGGQVYFVHNRVRTIDKMASFLKKIVPEVRLAIAHGQMHEEELERVMLAFLDGEYDLLLSTSIIESGLDIPRVNTIIIEGAHKFGLAQLYQLRGRVGRANHRAYAYLLYPSKAVLSRDARERLLAIKEFSQLGSGFRLAMRDMEIRGSGNILGPEQHGNLIAVGLDLYCRLIEETMTELKGEKIKEEVVPQVELGIDAYIPEGYIPDIRQRFEAYKKISRADDTEDIRKIKEELRDRYGPLPEVVCNLLWIMELKVLARMIGITSISSRDGKVVIELPTGQESIPKIIRLADSNQRIRFDSIKTNLLYLHWDREREDGLRDIVEVLKESING